MRSSVQRTGCPACQARQRHQRHVRVDAGLDPEAAADVGGHVQPEPGNRQAERAGQHGHHRERPVEVGPRLDGRPHAVGVVLPAGHDRVALHRHGGVAREGILAADHVVGVLEGLLDRAERERAVRGHVARRVLVQPGRVPGQGGGRVRHGREGLVADLDEFRGVFGQVPVGGDDHGHGLADEPGPAGRARVVGHRRLDRQREGAQFGGHVVGADDGHHAGGVPRGRGVDAVDARVRMRAADDRRGQRARQGIQVVEEAALAAEQRGVLHAGQGGGHGRASASAVNAPAVSSRRRIFPTAEVGMRSTATRRLGRFSDGRLAAPAPPVPPAPSRR